MITDVAITDLIQKVDAYLHNTITREAFEIWFYDLSFDIEARHTGDIVDLTHEIEALLAESSTANWPIPSLRAELESAIAKYKTPSLQRRAG